MLTTAGVLVRNWKTSYVAVVGILISQNRTINILKRLHLKYSLPGRRPGRLRQGGTMNLLEADNLSAGEQLIASNVNNKQGDDRKQELDAGDRNFPVQFGDPVLNGIH